MRTKPHCTHYVSSMLIQIPLSRQVVKSISSLSSLASFSQASFSQDRLPPFVVSQRGTPRTVIPLMITTGAITEVSLTKMYHWPPLCDGPGLSACATAAQLPTRHNGVCHMRRTSIVCAYTTPVVAHLFELFTRAISQIVHLGAWLIASRRAM